MIQSLLVGNKVRLTGIDIEKDAEAIARWWLDPEYLALFSEEPTYPISRNQVKKKFKTDDHPDLARFRFGIHCLEDDRLIGIASIYWIEYTNGSAWLDVTIGSGEDRGKGYGGEALRLILDYAFAELNLHRLSCRVFEYNLTAQQMLASRGFRNEVRQRQALHRKQRRWDLLIMGMLQSDWAKFNSVSREES